MQLFRDVLTLQWASLQSQNFVMVEKIQIYEMVMLTTAAAHKLLNLAPEYNDGKQLVSQVHFYLKCVQIPQPIFWSRGFENPPPSDG